MNDSPAASAARLSRILLLAVLPATFTAAWAQQPRQSIELGALGQTTSNKVTPPFHVVYGPSSVSILGTHNSQVFGGPFVNYTYGIARFISLDARASYLFGKQPVIDLSGGNALLVSGGIRATFGPRRIGFYLRLAPGFASFSEAGTAVSQTGYDTSRLTHLTLDEGGGLELHLARATAFRLDASRILYAEGGHHNAFNGFEYTLPGQIEGHMTFSAGLVRYFGKPLPAPVPAPSAPSSLRNEVVLAFALQQQPHLAFATPYLSSDSGLAISASHAFAKWIGLDTSAIVLPGGDAPNFQDGGTETELLAGVRLGLTRSRYGIFAKWRAGAASFGSTINENALAPPPVRSWDFATDYGTILEYYPTAGHFLMRLDAGNVYTLYNAVTVKEPPPQLAATQGARYTNSLQLLVGAGWRF